MNGDKFPKDRWQREESIKRAPWHKRSCQWARKHYRRLFRRLGKRELYKTIKEAGE